MENRKEKLLKQYTARLKREGIVKSVLAGCTAGFSALVVIGLFSWLFAFKAGLFVALAAFAVISAGLSAALYFLKFKPTAKQVARRVDALGLEERLITMVELEGDDSYIARMQREDTEKALSSFNSMLIKIAVSASLIAAVAAVGIVGVGVTTVDALYYADVIPSGIDAARGTPETKTYTLKYVVEEGGVIYRVEDRNFEKMDPCEETVEEGGDGSTVYAYAGKGYVFVDWSDGYNLPYRQFKAVDSDRTVSARFEAVDEIDAQEPQRPPEGSGEGEGENQDGQEEGDGQPSDSNEGEGQEGDQKEVPSEPQDQDGEGGDSAGGGRDEDRNQIVDGKTYYPDQFDSAYEEAMDRMDSNSELSDPRKGAVSDYLGSIEKGGMGSPGEGSGGSEGTGGGSGEGSGSEGGN